MNFLSIFESRVSDIFGAARAPFSFKKLAKQAAHEMEDQTLVVNGVNTAPALYTVLVANDDDPLLAPYYPQLSREVCELVKAQAEKKSYTFVGEPLVRFMIDPSLKGGRFSVFASHPRPSLRGGARLPEGALGQPAGAHAPAPRRTGARPCCNACPGAGPEHPRDVRADRRSRRPVRRRSLRPRRRPRADRRPRISRAGSRPRSASSRARRR